MRAKRLLWLEKNSPDGWKRFQNAKAKLHRAQANQENAGSKRQPRNFDAEVKAAYFREKLRAVSEQSDVDLRQQLLNPTASEWPEHVDPMATVNGFGLYDCDFDGPLPNTTLAELAEWVSDHIRHFESLVRRNSQADALALARVVIRHGCYWLSFLTGKTEIPPEALHDEDKARAELLKLIVACEDGGTKDIVEASTKTVEKGETGNGSAKLRPCDRKAWSQYKSALEASPELKTDKEAYDWYVDNLSDEGETLPAFATWAKYIRKARAVFGEQKNKHGIGNESRSVVSVRQIDQSKRTKADR